MSSANVLPSAHSEGETQSIYPNLPGGPTTYPTETQSLLPQDFRLEKVNEIAAALAQEVNHYRIVGKKYKRAKTVANWLAGGAGCLSAAASSASLVTALPAAVPLGAVGDCLALASSGFIIAGKELDSKITKHQEIATLSLAKGDTVDRLISKAINDNRLSDSETVQCVERKS